MIYLFFRSNVEKFQYDTSQNLISNNNSYFYNPLNYLYNPLDYWVNPYYHNWYSYPTFSTSYYTKPLYNKIRNYRRSHRRMRRR